MRSSPDDNPFQIQRREHSKLPDVALPMALYLRLGNEEKITISPGELKTDFILVEGQEIAVGTHEDRKLVSLVATIKKLSDNEITIETVEKWTNPNFASNS